MAIDRNAKRTHAPEQDAKIRNTNFNEVNLGYDLELAKIEAARCIECAKAPCTKGCPVNVDIPGFIREIKQGNLEKSVAILKKDNNLPSVCGRVCPQESQCEALCVRNNERMGGAVSIGKLERFIGDYSLGLPREKVDIKPNGYSVAVIGSGPAGLSCAADCAVAGCKVTIYEAFHKTGGVLTYGIPEFRLPKSIVDKEIDILKDYGVKIELNTVIGKTITIPELQEEYDYIFIGTGAGLPMFLNLPGENLNGVLSANEFLTRVNLMKAYEKDAKTPIRVGKKVAVIGAGNVAMDAARTAKRMGAEEVSIIYRRTRTEMPARLEEIEHAVEEGIKLLELTNPVAIVGDKEVEGMTCVKMTLSDMDESGRRRPIVCVDSEHIVDCDMVIVSLGTTPNPLLEKEFKALNYSKKGTIIVNEETNMTNVDSIYAGGDAVTGAATVILAMGAGRTAATSIIKDIENKGNKI